MIGRLRLFSIAAYSSTSRAAISRASSASRRKSTLACRCTALDQIASVPSNGFEPRVIEKLGGASRARPLVPCIRVTIGLGYDNALDQRLGGRPVDRFSVQMRVAKQDETYDESHADRHSKNERDGFRRQPVPRGDNGSTLIGARRPDFVGTACLLDERARSRGLPSAISPMKGNRWARSGIPLTGSMLRIGLRRHLTGRA